jgi:biotin carboxyl carrier protein
MKMYRSVHAPGAARVESVHCTAGDAVGAGQLLVTLQALDSEPALPGSAA